jgi:F-type H+-transporting ATPase subunit b
VDINLTLVGQSIAMMVFVWFCMKYVWPPILGAIEDRQKQVADGIAAAEESKSKLASARSEADKLLEDARAQARGIVDQANTRATTIIEDARKEGSAQRQREVDEGKAEIELERNRVRDELRGHVAAIAIQGAERVLAREIDANAHREILDQLVGQI